MLTDQRDYISEIENKSESGGLPFCRSLIGKDQIWLKACRQAVQQNRREWLSEAAKEGVSSSPGILLIQKYLSRLSCRPDAPSIARTLAGVAYFAVNLNDAISFHHSPGEPLETNMASGLARELYSLAGYLTQMEPTELELTELRANEFALKASHIAGRQNEASKYAVAMLSELQLLEPGWQLSPLRDLILWLLDADPNEESRRVRVHVLLDRREQGGQVVTLRLQLCQPGEAIYPDPRQMMFFTFDQEFQVSLREAWAYSRKTFGRTEEVRWSLGYYFKDSKEDKDLPLTIEGGSLGAGFALGLTHLFEDKSLIGIDWAITGSITRNGEIVQVDGLVRKLAAATEAGLNVIIPKIKPRSQPQPITDQISEEDLKSWRERIEICEAKTVNQAFEFATGSVKPVIDYLEYIERFLSQSPAYYPKQFNFDFAHIRQKVRVRAQQVVDANNVDAPGRQAEETDAGEVLDWDDVKGVQRGVILGDAGFGKTWLLKYEGWRLARDQLARLRNGEIAVKEVKLPIYILLGDLTVKLGAVRTLVDVTDAIVRTLRSGGQTPVKKVLALLEESIKNNNACLLLDGLDEVPFSLRAPLIGGLEDLRCRIFITSRISGYQSLFRLRDDESDRELEVIALEEFQIGLFIKAWFASLEKQINSQRRLTPGAVSADDRARRLYDFLIDNPNLMALARIPLLLTFICLLGRDPAALPSRRTNLYREILSSLLQGDWRLGHERTQIGEIPRKLEILQQVAWHFAENGNKSNWLDPMPAVELAGVIRSLKRDEDPPGILETLSERDGILTRDVEPPYPRESDVPYRFLHHTFREFLVAEFLAGQPVEKWQEVVQQHCWDPEWENVIVLLAGMLSPEGVTRLLQILLSEDDPFHAMLFLAGDCLGEVTPAYREEISLTGEIIARIEALLLSPNKHDREQAVRVLTRTGVLSRSPATQVSFDDLPRRAINFESTVVSNAQQTSKARESLDNLLAGLKWADKQTRLKMVQDLSERPEAQALVALRVLLKDENRAVRKQACEALGRRRDSQSVSSLVQLVIAERDNNVLAAAALALGKIGDIRATEVLLGLVSKEDSFVQLNAIIALRMLADPSAETLLIKVLFDTKKESSVRAEAASALGVLGQSRAVESLFRCIREEKDVLIRSASIKSLGKLREERAIEELILLLCHDEGAIALAATEALKSIAGELTKAEHVYDAAVNRLNQARINYYKDDRCRANVDNLLAGIAPHVSAANKAQWRARRARYPSPMDPS